MCVCFFPCWLAGLKISRATNHIIYLIWPDLLMCSPVPDVLCTYYAIMWQMCYVFTMLLCGRCTMYLLCYYVADVLCTYYAIMWQMCYVLTVLLCGRCAMYLLCYYVADVLCALAVIQSCQMIHCAYDEVVRRHLVDLNI